MSFRTGIMMSTPQKLTASTPASNQLRSHLFNIVLIIVVPIVAYSNSLDGVFIFDDEYTIVKNASIRSFEDTINASSRDIPIGLLRRDLVRFTLTLNYAIGGLEPAGYHIANLIFHISAGLLLYGVIRQTLLLQTNWLSDFANPIAVCTALIWLAHPIQTESVTYVIQRLESIVSLFYLAVFYCVIRSHSAKHPWIWQIFGFVAMFLGVYSKEIIVTAPLLLLIFDRAFLSGSVKEIIAKRKWLYLALFICLCVLVANTILIKGPPQPYKNTEMSPQTIPTSWEYLRSQPGVILHYLQLLVVPSGFCLDYLWPVANTPLKIYGLGAIVLAMVATSIVLLFKHPKIGFLPFAFFFVLAPTSSIKPLLLAFEHRVYLASAPLFAGFVVLVFWLAVKYIPSHQKALSSRRSSQLDSENAALRIVLITFALLVSLLCLLTFNRNKVYLNEESVWRDVTEKAPWNARGWNNLGVYYSSQEGQLDDAMACFNKAIEITPRFPDALKNKAIIHIAQGEPQLGLSSINKAVEFVPKNPHLHSVRGEAQFRLGDLDAAIESHQTAIELDPKLLKSLEELAQIYQEQGDFENAEEYYLRLLKLVPEYVPARMALADICRSRGDIVEALNYLDQAAKLEPENASIFYVRGLTHALQSESKAIEDFKHTVSIEPSFSPAYIEIGNIHFDNGDYSKAAEWLKKGVAGSLPRSTRIEALNRMATSYEQLGNAAEADRCRSAIEYLQNGQD